MADLVIKTPRGVIRQVETANGKIKAELTWNKGFGNEYTKKFTKAQKYVDNAVLRLSEPYVPFLTGTLVKSGILGTEIGSGEVKYIAPYSKFQYYGKVMVGVKTGSAWAQRGEKKITTNKDLKYHGGGLRGSYWFERMKADKKDEILKGARRIANND